MHVVGLYLIDFDDWQDKNYVFGKKVSCWKVSYIYDNVNLDLYQYLDKWSK